MTVEERVPEPIAIEPEPIVSRVAEVVAVSGKKRDPSQMDLFGALAF